MIPLLSFVVALGIVLIILFRRSGTLSGRNMLEFAIGFLGWFLVNTYLWVWVRGHESGTEFIDPFRLLAFLVTLGRVPVLA